MKPRADLRAQNVVSGWLAVAVFLVAALAGPGLVVRAFAEKPYALPVQVPYETPPRPGVMPDTSVPPSTRPLDADELKRAEALLPLLEGKQEFWAMGEFVHLGPSATPILVKALKMPAPRIRFNAIETLLMIKDPSVVPALVEVAQEANEMPRIREHALRVAVRLNPALAPPAVEAMAKDRNPTIRKTAAFEARYVRQKAVVPVLIGLIPDEERFVSITAINSLWLLTRHESEIHDWDSSTKQERAEWTQEWMDWWKDAQATFELPEPRQPRKPL